MFSTVPLNLTIPQVEALELSLPSDEKPTSLFAQASLHGHVQRTPVGGPKWDHAVHFVVNDLNSDKISISVHKEFLFSPNCTFPIFLFIHFHQNPKIG